jgi:transcriptional regulator with XRE-family HTH domain
MTQTIGDRIRRARGETSQSELAERAGTTQARISLLESGLLLDPRIGTARRLAEALGVDLGWLLTGRGSGPVAGNPDSGPASGPDPGENPGKAGKF